MTECTFVADDETGWLHCVRCGQRVRGSSASRIYSECAAICVHRRDFVRGVKVECCEGRAKFASAATCNVHGRCLPRYAPTGEALARWLAEPESALYRLCASCPDFSPVE